MLTITNVVTIRGKLTGDQLSQTAAPTHKVKVSITGRKDLTRFATLIGATAKYTGDAQLAELSTRLKQPDARGLNITMPAKKWAAIEQQIANGN